jgi:hypothetical protein
MTKKDKFEFIADALIANDLMEQTRNYLESGRKFESLRLDRLRDKWVMAFKTWCNTRYTGDSKEMDDTDAGLRLRDIEPPYERARVEAAAMREEIRRDRSDNRGVLAAVERFLEALKKPQN